MNGWHRLWVFVSLLLAVLASGVALSHIGDTKPVITESTLAYLQDTKPAKSGFDPSRPFVEVETRKVIVPAGYQDVMNRAAELTGLTLLDHLR